MCNYLFSFPGTCPQLKPITTKPPIDSHSSILANTGKPSSENSSSKKREDLTSLGSDDSGIICGSEPDQASLNRIRRSHESIDSGEIDAEEECIEILDTNSMDEDYRMLQSDLLCFYQSSEDETIKEKPTYTKNAPLSLQPTTTYANQPDTEKIRYRDRTVRPICVPINFEDDEPSTDETAAPLSVDPTPTVNKADGKPEPNAKPEHIKNEVIFKSIFGATKNAIFRTAQSIIENHEKKNLAKRDGAVTTPIGPDAEIKSPTEFTKKKDFFTLKPCSNKNKVSAASTPETITPSPDVEQKMMPKSLSAFSLGRLVTAEKGRVPGVVKCIIKSTPEVEEPLSKVEKGSHGLLRFFESPIFNIHFALHYLFYSKEPGVLSFIGNKIFSFKDNEVDLYIPQLILMYIQMDELAEVLDPYLVYRCRRTADFSLKCSWLLEAYNYSADSFSPSSNLGKKSHLMLMRELYPRKVKRDLRPSESLRDRLQVSPSKKTHHRSHSDATGLLNGGSMTPLGTKVYQAPVRLCLGDLSTGRAFDNGCTCFETVRGAVNGLLGQKTVCSCGVSFTNNCYDLCCFTVIYPSPV